MPLADPRINDPALVWLLGCVLPAALISLLLVLTAIGVL